MGRCRCLCRVLCRSRAHAPGAVAASGHDMAGALVRNDVWGIRGTADLLSALRAREILAMGECEWPTPPTRQTSRFAYRSPERRTATSEPSPELSTTNTRSDSYASAAAWPSRLRPSRSTTQQAGRGSPVTSPRFRMSHYPLPRSFRKRRLRRRFGAGSTAVCLRGPALGSYRRSRAKTRAVARGRYEQTPSARGPVRLTAAFIRGRGSVFLRR